MLYRQTTVLKGIRTYFAFFDHNLASSYRLLPNTCPRKAPKSFFRQMWAIKQPRHNFSKQIGTWAPYRDRSQYLRARAIL